MSVLNVSIDDITGPVLSVASDVSNLFQSKFNMQHFTDPLAMVKGWDWEMLLNPAKFDWESGRAPFADLAFVVWATIIYASVLIVLSVFMNLRKRANPSAEGFAIQHWMVIHNYHLTLISLAMAVGTLYGVLPVLSSHSSTLAEFVESYSCDSKEEMNHGITYFWCYIFYASKFYELLDTVIIVLRQREISFLHLFHHTVVMYLFWAFMETKFSIQWVAVVANSVIHVVMYWYYLRMAAKVPTDWRNVVTRLQIVQFVFDLSSTWPYFVYTYRHKDVKCGGHPLSFWFGQTIGFIFLFLFIRLLRANTRADRAKRAAPAKGTATTAKPTATTAKPANTEVTPSPSNVKAKAAEGKTSPKR